MKGRLKCTIQFWRRIGANDFVLSIIEQGYKLPLLSTPPSIALHNNKSALEHQEFVTDAISELVNKGLALKVIEIPTVVNPLSVAVQKSGKLRLILDLRYVNMHIWKTFIKFEDWKVAFSYLSNNDYMFSFDLKSGYHHIDIFHHHQTFLGFSWTSKNIRQYYVFTVLPFGLATAPYVFSKCLRPLIKYWRSLGYFIVLYLDDGWCRAPNEETAIAIAKRVKSDLINARLVPNHEKSQWVPTQKIE